MCVFFILNRSFYSSTSSTPIVRANPMPVPVGLSVMLNAGCSCELWRVVGCRLLAVGRRLFYMPHEGFLKVGVTNTDKCSFNGIFSVSM